MNKQIFRKKISIKVLSIIGCLILIAIIAIFTSPQESNFFFGIPDLKGPYQAVHLPKSLSSAGCNYGPGIWNTDQQPLYYECDGNFKGSATQQNSQIVSLVRAAGYTIHAQYIVNMSSENLPVTSGQQVAYSDGIVQASKGKLKYESDCTNESDPLCIIYVIYDSSWNNQLFDAD